jgi:hypothetical protein
MFLTINFIILLASPNIDLPKKENVIDKTYIASLEKIQKFNISKKCDTIIYKKLPARITKKSKL